MNKAATPAPAATTGDTANASVKPDWVATPATALAARMVAETCEPTDDPTERTRALNPVASPVWWAGTASRMRLGMAANARPMPDDITKVNPRTSTWLSCAKASRPRPNAVIADPMVSGTLLPKRVPITPDRGPNASMPNEPGSRSRPARVASTPKPYPVDTGACASIGIRMNEPNMPNPTSNVAMFVISTGGLRSAEMSTNGCAVRRSRATHSARTTTPAAMSPIVRGLPQPTWPASETAISGRVSPTARTRAPRTSTRDGVFTGDSGT